MTRVNWARVLLGGLLAGVVINTFEFVLHYFVIDEAWRSAWTAAQAAQPTEGESAPALMTGAQIAVLNLWGFLVGLVSVWLYVAIRPRHGSGPKTALYAGTVVWALTLLLAAIKPDVGAGLSTMAIFSSVVVGFAEINLGTLLGAGQYRESPSETGQADRGGA